MSPLTPTPAYTAHPALSDLADLLGNAGATGPGLTIVSWGASLETRTIAQALALAGRHALVGDSVAHAPRAFTPAYAELVAVDPDAASRISLHDLQVVTPAQAFEAVLGRRHADLVTTVLGRSGYPDDGGRTMAAALAELAGRRAVVGVVSCDAPAAFVSEADVALHATFEEEDRVLRFETTKSRHVPVSLPIEVPLVRNAHGRWTPRLR